MPKIIISPYSRPLRNGKNNPKNYPHWGAVVKGLKEKGFHVVQIGVEGESKIDGVDEVMFNKSLKELTALLKECDTFISVDNFFQHLGHLHGKPGVVVFGQSDPKIFGHPENINLLKDEKYLREKQFDIWEACQYLEEAFVEPATIIDSVSNSGGVQYGE